MRHFTTFAILSYVACFCAVVVSCKLKRIQLPLMHVVVFAKCCSCVSNMCPTLVAYYLWVVILLLYLLPCQCTAYHDVFRSFYVLWICCITTRADIIYLLSVTEKHRSVARQTVCVRLWCESKNSRVF